MRLYYFCCATRLLATRPVQSGVHNVLHAVVPPVSGNQWLVWSRLGGQTGRSYSQTNVRKPSLGSKKADTSRPICAPVTPPGRGPDTNPRENRDHLTRLSPPVQDQQKYQPSGSNAYSPPSGGGNLPGDSGGGSLFPNSNPLMGAALTTIVGLGMGEYPFNSVQHELACICLPLVASARATSTTRVQLITVLCRIHSGNLKGSSTI